MTFQKLKIRDICDFVGGAQPPKEVFISEEQDGYIRLIQTRDYKTDAYKTYIPANLARRFCSKTDIMIGRYGPPVFQILRGLEGSYNVALMKAIPKANVLNDYLYYILKQRDIFEYVDKLSLRTGGQTGVDLDSLNEYPVLLPSKNYQEGVLGILKGIDDKIEINKTINAELEAMAKTIFDYWLVQFDFHNAKGKPYKASGGKMVWSEDLKREIPLGWEVGTLNDLGTIIGGSTPSTAQNENFDCNGTPWITPKDLSLNTGNKFITRGELSVSKNGLQSASLNIMPSGTILLSSRAPIGYMAIARKDVTTNQGFKSFVPSKGYSTPVVYYLIKNALPAIVNHASGSTFKEVSGSVLKSINVLLPSETISKALTEILEPIFKQQDTLELEIQRLTELRDWLLPMLLNGQVKVGDVEQKLFLTAEPGFYKKRK